MHFQGSVSTFPTISREARFGGKQTTRYVLCAKAIEIPRKEYQVEMRQHWIFKEAHFKLQLCEWRQFIINILHISTLGAESYMLSGWSDQSIEFETKKQMEHQCEVFCLITTAPITNCMLLCFPELFPNLCLLWDSSFVAKGNKGTNCA